MAITVKDLKVDYAKSPVGVNTKFPKFSWIIESDEKNVKQNGYRIEVYEWIHTFMWDSGYVESDETANIQYRGIALEKDTPYFVKAYITVNGEEHIVETSFRTGLLEYSFPHISWIRPNVEEREYKFSPLFRREFALKSDEIAYATCYITSRGWYELYINGARPDEKEVMAPATSNRYDSSYLQAYDITELLQKGKNAVGIWLGNGYSRNFRPSPAYHDGKRFWAYISIVFTDGSYQHIWTDDSWKWHESPIIMDHIYDGEWYDARKELIGWAKAGFNDSDWKSTERARYHELITPVFTDPVRILGTRPLASINKLADDKYIYDFKYNGSGVLKIKVKGDPGAEIRMHHAENIFPDGTLQPWTNRNAEATDRYILKGDGEEIYIPRFTYHCFRYVEFTIIGNAEILDAEALVYGADMMSESEFKCSSDMINRIQENFIRTLKTNFMSWPCDTGVRDERTACSMDIMVYEDMAMHNCSAHNYFYRWNTKGVASSGRPDWSGDDIVLSYLLWKHYNDTDVLKKNYPALRGLAKSAMRIFSEDIKYQRKMVGFGDWSAPNPTNEYEDSFSSVLETNYAMWYCQLGMMKEIAKELGEYEDIKDFEALAEHARKFYYDNFYDEKTKLFSEGKQTPNLLPLTNGMVSEEDKPAILSALIESIRTKDDSHLDTGIFGTRKLIEALCQSKEGLELVWDILHQTTYPSFGQQIVGRDATTAWEQWYGLQGMMTCSHSMFCGIGADFYKKFAGIESVENAYKKVKIQPMIPEKLEFVDCKLETIRGIYSVSWKKEKDGFKMKVTIPANCCATIILPSGDTHEVGSGQYEF